MSVSFQSIDTTAARLKWLKLDWTILCCLSCLALSLCFLGLGGFGILDPSDGYYAEVAREMVQTGNFLTPYLNYVPWFDKPILCYWLIAFSYKIFGVSEFAARVPSAVLGASLVPLCFAFCRQFFRRRSAVFSALVLLSSPLWLVLAHLSLTDMTLSFFVWVSTGCLILRVKRPSLSLVLCGYVAAGLGVLAKGPLAIFLIGAFTFIYLAIASRNLAEFKANIIKLNPLAGALIVLIVAAPWCVTESLTTHGAFFIEFFLNQNLSRALGTVDHKAGLFYYVPMFLGGFFPWSLFLLPWGRWRRILKWRGEICRVSDRGKLIAFSAGAGIFALTFFTLLPTKLATYILPSVPAFSIFVGARLDGYLRLKSFRILLAVTSILALAGIAGIAGLLINATELPSDITYAALLYFTALIAIPILALRKSSKILGLSLLAVTICGAGVLCPLGLRYAYELKCKDFQALIEAAKQRHLNPTIVGRRLPSAIFYFRRPVKVADTIGELVQAVDGKKDNTECLLANDGVVDSLRATGHKVKVVEKRGAWSLLFVQSLTPP